MWQFFTSWGVDVLVTRFHVSSMKVLVLAHWVPGAGAKILSKQISFLSNQSLD